MTPEHPPQSVHTTLLRAVPRLAPVEATRLDAEILLARVLGRERSWLVACAETLLGAPQLAAFEALLARRAQGEPLAYITGEREFWSLKLRVTPDVLVPRPETELVVERALALLDSAPADVADLGTGAGAIALALAHERPLWRLLATDRSAAALAVARANTAALGLANVRCAAGDWLAPLADQRFALIASNPPYIAEGDLALQDRALQHEPPEALSSGPDGLADLKIIITGAADHLLPGGWLVLEHGADQGPAVTALLVAQGYAHVRCHADLAGRPRVTEARRP